MMENLSKKETDIELWKSQRIPNKMNLRRLMLIYTIMKMPKLKGISQKMPKSRGALS